MSWERILPVALGVPFRDDEILVARHHDAVANQEFYRPLGGGVEFGERSEVGVRREFQEELAAHVEVVDRIATFENGFEFRGAPGHEVVFRYEVEFVDDHFYETDTFEAVGSTDEVYPVRWHSVSDFVGGPSAEGDLLYPERLPGLLQD